MMRACLAFSLFVLLSVSALGQTTDGYWNPKYLPGDPSAKMKTLDEIEPRVAISELPFVISQSGAYYLTRNVQGVAGSNGITIAANDVKLDLNGFALNGVAGSMHGIEVVGDCHNVTIRNGTVRFWDKHGIEATFAMESRFENLTAFTNKWSGIQVGGHAYVDRCAAYMNGQIGIKAQPDATMSECKVADNGGAGINAMGNSRIIGCVANMNMVGIQCDSYTCIRDCIVTGSRGDGIQVMGKSRVVDNLSGSNAGAGVKISGSYNRIENNNLTDNMGGGVVSMPSAVGNLITGNSVSGGASSSNYVWSTQDSYGAVIDAAQNRGAITNSNPWANFKF